MPTSTTIVNMEQIQKREILKREQRIKLRFKNLTLVRTILTPYYKFCEGDTGYFLIQVSFIDIWTKKTIYGYQKRQEPRWDDVVYKDTKTQYFTMLYMPPDLLRERGHISLPERKGEKPLDDDGYYQDSRLVYYDIKKHKPLF